MELTIAVQNLGLGGLRTGSGDPDHRWPQLAERINSAAERVGAQRVDAVLLQFSGRAYKPSQLAIESLMRVSSQAQVWGT
ncbi:hypothetical protein [Streptomyces sp. NPDC001948]